MKQRFATVMLLGLLGLGLTGVEAWAQSLYERQSGEAARDLAQIDPGAARAAVNPIASPPPEPRTFRKHDIVHIVISESTKVKNEQSASMEKEADINASVSSFPELLDFLELRFKDGGYSTSELPKVQASADREYEAEGEIEHQSSFTARIAATVLEVKPNGSLLLEARQSIVTDGETQRLVLSGMCAEADVTAANTVFSYQLADLRIHRETEGDLRDNAEKGFITRIFDAIFAF
ncbi:MAG: flagellar basal body L-ring protein FlgH [Phycisphaerales bacterium JB038]